MKYLLRNQVVMWFGHIFSKQRMAADPAKVEHIKTWKAPKSKKEVKSVLQTVQFVAQYMRSKKGSPHSDITAQLRALTRLHARFKWTREYYNAFEELKRRISHKMVLVLYRLHPETRRYMDHGPSIIVSE